MERKSLIVLRNMERGKYFRVDADVIVDGESLGDMLVEASGDGPETGKESEGNAKTIVRVHQRVDRIEQSIKTVRGVGTFIVTALTGLGAWLGLVNNK